MVTLAHHAYDLYQVHPPNQQKLKKKQQPTKQIKTMPFVQGFKTSTPSSNQVVAPKLLGWISFSEAER